jgi:hypothetical protein
LYIPTLSNADARIIMHYLNSEGKVIGAEDAATYAAPSPYFTFSSTIHPPEGTTRVRMHIHIQATANGAAGVLYVDSVSLKRGVEEMENVWS